VSEQLGDSVAPAASVPAEPSGRSGLPGPGILAAIGWVVVLLLFQGGLLGAALWAEFDKGLFTLPLITLTGFLAASYIVGRKIGRDSRRALALRALNWSHVGCLLVLVLPLVIVLLGISSCLTSAYEAAGLRESLLAPHSIYREFRESAGELTTPMAVVIIVVFGAVLPGVYEELYLRAFIGRGLVARWGVVGGVVLTSILFGALHVHPIQSVVTAIGGIALHAVYLWSRSLLAPIVLHAMKNSLLFLIALVPENSLPALLTENDRLPWPLILTALVSVAAVCWLYYSVRVRWVLPNGSAWTPGYVTAEAPPAELGARPECRRAGRWPLVVTVAAYFMFISVFVSEVLW
jgi:uncharacterized protein